MSGSTTRNDLGPHAATQAARRFTLVAALVAFLFTTFGPTAALALARATGDAPIVVELCSSSGIKRVILEQSAAAENERAPADARPAPADCKYCKLLTATLAPPSSTRWWLPETSSCEPETEAVERPTTSALWPSAAPRAPPRA